MAESKYLPLLCILVWTFGKTLAEDMRLPPCASRGDLLVILDSSGSINYNFYNNWVATLDFAKRLADTVIVGRSEVRVALIRYADTAEVIFDFNRYSTAQAIKAEIDRLGYRGGRTNLPAALRMAREMVFAPKAGDRSYEPNYIVLVSDGQVIGNDRPAAMMEADRLKDSGVTIVTVGVTGERDEAYLMAIASDNNMLLTFDTFDNTFILRRSLDIVFILDSSGSVQYSSVYNWFYVKTFMKYLVDLVDVRRGQIRVGAVKFNEVAVVEFDLNGYRTSEQLKREIDKIQYVGGKTNLAEALSTARSKLFELTVRQDDHRPRVALLITDGRPTVDIDRTEIEARRLKEVGVHLIVVAIEGETDLALLERIASFSPTPANPTRKAVVSVKDYYSLFLNIRAILDRLCPEDRSLRVRCYRNCAGLQEGLYQYCRNGRSMLRDCNRVVACYGNRTTVIPCPTPTIWDNDFKVCQRTSLTCPMY